MQSSLHVLFCTVAMFGSVEANKTRLSIQEYSIAQTSLEQIFNQFAAQQDEEKGPASGIAFY
jgi:ATP-binding cassette, subfamily A (ABC1), member 3